MLNEINIKNIEFFDAQPLNTAQRIYTLSVLAFGLSAE